MRLWPNVYILAGSVALVMFSVAVRCVPAAPPTPESTDTSLLRAPEPSAPTTLKTGVGKRRDLTDTALYKEVSHEQEVYRPAFGGRT